MKKRRQKAARKAVTEALDLPGEILLDEPRFVLEGRSKLRCENHKGIVEYTEHLLRLRVDGGEVKISGESLVLSEFGYGLMEVRGQIDGIALM